MRAAQYYGKEDVRLEDLPDPQCKPNEVIVAPAYCGICGTDMHEYIMGPHDSPIEPHPITGETLPITLGHEFSGVVIEVGDEVKSVKVGDRVAVKGSLECGECEPCLNDKGHACVVAGNVGLTGRGGGLAERIACEEHWLFKLPDDIPLDVGALSEPLSVAEHGISLVRPSPNSQQSALVLGCGAIGLAVIQLLRARGLTTIIASELSSARRQSAMSFGASHAFDPRTSDIRSEVENITAGAGTHLVFDCAGVNASIKTAISAVRIHGTIVTISIFANEVSFNPNPLLYKEVTYKGALSHTRDDWHHVIDLVGSGIMEPSKMITKVIPLENVVEDGLKTLARNEEGLVKILVEVNTPSKLQELVAGS